MDLELAGKVVLITGASGGMVGAAAYAGRFEQGPLESKFNADLGLDPLAEALAEDSLTPVVQTMIAHDFTIGTLTPKPSALAATTSGFRCETTGFPSAIASRANTPCQPALSWSTTMSARA